MMPQLKLYEPPLDDGEEDETPEIPCIDSDAFDPIVPFVFALLLLLGGSFAALLWAIADLFVP